MSFGQYLSNITDGRPIEVEDLNCQISGVIKRDSMGDLSVSQLRVRMYVAGVLGDFKPIDPAVDAKLRAVLMDAHEQELAERVDDCDYAEAWRDDK